MLEASGALRRYGRTIFFGFQRGIAWTICPPENQTKDTLEISERRDGPIMIGLLRIAFVQSGSDPGQ
jgi:hypothetical protein